MLLLTACFYRSFGPRNVRSPFLCVFVCMYVCACVLFRALECGALGEPFGARYEWAPFLLVLGCFDRRRR